MAQYMVKPSQLNCRQGHTKIYVSTHIEELILFSLLIDPSCSSYSDIIISSVTEKISSSICFNDCN
jgi:hypothetical protein